MDCSNGLGTFKRHFLAMGYKLNIFSIGFVIVILNLGIHRKLGYILPLNFI